MKSVFRLAALALAVLVGSSFAAAQDWRYDRDDRGYGYDNLRHGIHEAREFGYRDGAQVGREDTWSGKPFNPDPRGRYAWANRGYRRDFGSLNEYQEQYARAYREGYMNSFRGRRGYDGYGGYGYHR
jgi:hypothetical protein